MIRGLHIGIIDMHVGEHRRIMIPAKLAYGKKGRPPKVPPNSDLTFDVSLDFAGVDWGCDDNQGGLTAKRRDAARQRRKKAKPT
eukprot:NODE_18374_length_896_cov_2.983095.p2 GENE.NODE_18374_length_896_cov_2.983095~~NODE_18374_length_896_cov_2.983095.p2  ORF type:complete len:84 (-),score=9.33 NODE_18374_length_896_cov_2.983095:291-542(-)